MSDKPSWMLEAEKELQRLDGAGGKSARERELAGADDDDDDDDDDDVYKRDASKKYRRRSKSRSRSRSRNRRRERDRSREHHKRSHSRDRDRGDRDRDRRGKREISCRYAEREQGRVESRDKIMARVDGTAESETNMFGYPLKSSAAADNSGPQGILAGGGNDDGRYTWGHADQEEFGRADGAGDNVAQEEPKVKSNFGLSGALAKDERTGNVVNGVLLKYSEPLDAARPSQLWRLYVFKDDKVAETLFIHRQSLYLAGREDKVCDILLLHPSCSKQHAVIQFRAVTVEIDGEQRKTVRPYLLDLGATNKTFLNGSAIEDARYYELREKDVIKFGTSTREYVLIREESTS